MSRRRAKIANAVMQAERKPISFLDSHTGVAMIEIAGLTYAMERMAVPALSDPWQCNKQ